MRVKLQSKSGLLALAAMVSLSACTVLEGDKVDYKSAAKAGPSLEVPPDLTQLSRDSRYQVPGGTVTASSYQVGQAAPDMPVASRTLADIRVERDGQKRWLVVNRPADQLWTPIREFWLENGFVLTLDESNLGIMETDWAENRAKIPQDGIRGLLGKALDTVYSTSERDRFRTRLERAPNGGTEIYVSHRGMSEVYTNAKNDQTVWQPRPADPELEAEFLRRLMMKLGAPAEQAKSLVAGTPVKQTSRVADVAGAPVVQIDEGFDRAWRRVGLALDRTGFTVEDRDRTQGMYFVRYVEPNANKEEGFFSKMFSSDKKTAPLKYRISLKSEGESTTVSVLNQAGSPENSATAQRICKVIADELR